MTPNPMGRMLVTITAPHFRASLVIGRRFSPIGPVQVLETAPILRWALGQSWLTVKRCFDRHGYKHSMQPDPAGGSKWT